MRAEMHSLAVAIEHRRIDFVWQHRTDEQRIAFELREDEIAQLARHGTGLIQLMIVLHRRALMPSRHPTVHPRRVLAVERRAHRRQLLLAQYFCNAQEHPHPALKGCSAPRWPCQPSSIAPL